MKLRERGVYIYDGKYCSIAPNRGKNVADVRAAAPVFLSALAYTFMQTKSMEVAVKYASVALAVLEQNGGGVGGVPTAAAIGEYCKQNDIN